MISGCCGIDCWCEGDSPQSDGSGRVFGFGSGSWKQNISYVAIENCKRFSERNTSGTATIGSDFEANGVLTCESTNMTDCEAATAAFVSTSSTTSPIHIQYFYGFGSAGLTGIVAEQSSEESSVYYSTFINNRMSRGLIQTNSRSIRVHECIFVENTELPEIFSTSYSTDFTIEIMNCVFSTSESNYQSPHFARLGNSWGTATAARPLPLFAFSECTWPSNFFSPSGPMNASQRLIPSQHLNPTSLHPQSQNLQARAFHKLERKTRREAV
jgi:hypothetical protein